MNDIHIKLSSELKRKLKQHPSHRYGNCEEYYLSIIQRHVESPEYQLAIANQRIATLEYQVQSLKKDVEREKVNADRFQRLWAVSIRKANLGSGEGPGQDRSTSPPGKHAV